MPTSQILENLPATILSIPISTMAPDTLAPLFAAGALSIPPWNAVTVSWRNSVKPDTVGTRIVWSTTPPVDETDGAWADVGGTPFQESSYEIIGLQPDTLYHIALFAFNAAGDFIQPARLLAMTSAEQSVEGTLAGCAIGEIVKIQVGSVVRNFIVVHKGNPSEDYHGFYGSVVLMQQDVDAARQWNVGNLNNYESSAINAYLNNEYLNSITQNIRSKVKQVRIPHRPGSVSDDKKISSGAEGLLTSVFLLSMYECGYDTDFNTAIAAEGSIFDYFIAGAGTDANNKRLARRAGAAVAWWLRSPITSGTVRAWFISVTGAATSGANGNTSTAVNGPRPAFVLPSTLLVDDEGVIQA